jgi:hypothetical protein
MNLPIVGFDWQMGLLPQLIEPNAVATTLPTPVFTVAERYGYAPTRSTIPDLPVSVLTHATVT